MSEYLIHDREHRAVIYLGYNMKLSRREYQIYRCIDDGQGEYVSAEYIIEKCYSGIKPSKGGIKAHICHINQKSKAIGNRHIIVSGYGKGYKITNRP